MTAQPLIFSGRTQHWILRDKIRQSKDKVKREGGLPCLGKCSAGGWGGIDVAAEVNLNYHLSTRFIDSRMG